MLLKQRSFTLSAEYLRSFCSRLPCVLVLEYLQQDRGFFCLLTAGPISCIFRWHKVSCAIMCIEISFLGWCWGFTLCLCPLTFWSINPFGLQRPPHCHLHVASSLSDLLLDLSRGIRCALSIRMPYHRQLGGKPLSPRSVLSRAPLPVLFIVSGDRVTWYESVS